MEEQMPKREETDTLETMVARQIELSDNVHTTARLLRFALQITSENLETMREQLNRIRDMTADDAKGEKPGEDNETP